MVDRITPATTDRERAILRDNYGLEDNWPVFCEEFRQWVVEDKFPAGRPALEKVGVTFTSDVAPYELMKIRDPQWRTCCDRLSRRIARHPFRPRGDGGCADRSLPRDADEARNHTGGSAAAESRSGSLSQEGRRAFRQPEDRRHDFAPLSRRIEPAAKVRIADRPGSPESRRGRRVASRSYRPCGAATATENRRAEKPFRRTIRAGSACRRRRSPPAPTRRRFWRCATSSASLPRTQPMWRRFPARCRPCGRNGVRATLADYLAGER